MRVKPIDIKDGMSIDDVIAEYKKSGVLGAGSLARCVDIFEEMLRKKATIFLGVSGPLVPSGMRNVITEMIRLDYVNVVVTTGANIVHDLIEAAGGSHYVGDFLANDIKLRERRIGRIGNVYTRMKDFEEFEKYVQDILGDISEEIRKDISIKELLWEMGKRIEDKNSFLKTGYEKKVPVFSPALIDSMLGLQLWFFSQDNKIVLNAIKDMRDLADIVYKAKKTGAIFLGGGVPKHYILGASLLREGIDYGIQITMDREEAGSISGAKLEEGISWGKAQKDSKVATVIGDVTVILPIILSSLRERLG